MHGVTSSDDRRFHGWRPAGALAGAVSSVVDYRMPAMPGGVHRGMPSPWLTVVFSYRDPVPVLVPAGSGFAPTTHRTLVGGLHSRAVLLPQEGEQSGVELSVHPLAAPALLGATAAELSAQVVDLGDLLGHWAGDLADALAELPPGPARFTAIRRALAARIGAASRATEPRPELAHAWRLIAGSGGRARVAEVATAVGWSRRHLSGQLRRASGLGPKDLARCARLSRSSRLMKAGAGGLADIATACGYVDQAHMTGEWRTMAGCTPKAWIRAELPALGELPFLQDVGAEITPS